MWILYLSIYFKLFNFTCHCRAVRTSKSQFSPPGLPRSNLNWVHTAHFWLSALSWPADEWPTDGMEYIAAQDRIPATMEQSRSWLRYHTEHGSTWELQPPGDDRTLWMAGTMDGWGAFEGRSYAFGQEPPKAVAVVEPEPESLNQKQKQILTRAIHPQRQRHFMLIKCVDIEQLRVMLSYTWQARKL